MLKEKTVKHPLAGQTMTGADIILQVLSQESVDTVFGYSGGAILPTYDAIFRFNAEREEKPEAQIRLVVPANEQGAGFMAAGYARASGKVGVFMVTSGPGATNAVTPIRDCMADSVPVVMISGQVSRAAIGTDAFQEAPIFNIMSPCAKHVFLVSDPEKLEETLRTAFEIARTGRPGPVVVDVPKDVQNWCGIFKGEGKLDIKGYRQRMSALRSALSDEQADSFFELLERSERPLLYVGGGVISGNATETLRQFAHRFQIPVVNTLMGIGSLDSRDPLALHMLGMHGTAYANYAVEDCDFLIAVGARFDDRVAGNIEQFAPNARAIAHIDIDASEIGKVKLAHWHHVGDARETLEQLLESGEHFSKDHSAWLGHLQELRARHPMNYDRDSALVQPYYVLEELNRITQGQAIVSTGVGQHQMWAAQYLDFAHPRSWLTSGSMGTMGFGLPAAIGAQIACPDRLVIDVDGDGSIRMNLGEMETVTTYNLPVKILLLNNVGDGMVRQWQKLYFNDRFAASDKSLHQKDFVRAAQADGFGFSKRLDRKEDVRGVLEEFLAYPGPAFLEVMIDPDAGVYPMVGPGMGYRNMITGEHIPCRDMQEDSAGRSAPASDMF
ncbi:biosynthetic-type acetolactate synthase large subunit [Thermithiobacillus plumbiphilus]|uniref:Acetolactate synthase n=1 Tax=Thermithiobacillus plumbiphilus TaxID=1729899 RepID=A0ABU9DBY3_9PROT